MNKTAIKNFAVWARNKLIADITYKAGLIGVSEKGIAEPLSNSSNDLQFFDIGTKDYVQVTGAEIEQRKALVKAIRDKEQSSDYATAFKSIIEEVAYTWFNRMIAIRFMEVNDYLPSRIRVLSSENPAKNEPDFVTTPFDTDMEFTTEEQDKIMQLKDENKLDELFRMLFIKQCNKLHEILPELFEETNNYIELLLSISFTDSEGVVYHLVHDIDEDDFNVEKEGQVEIIGWLYQYYISEKHDQIVNIYKGTVKKEDIPAATQLFTIDWVVRYMVDNSLGRYWIERHPESNLADKLQFFVTPKDGQITYINEKVEPEELTFFDPCMGSGHILVYAFDVLMEIYREAGYTDRDAATSILENNLFGLDIDERAYQLAYFAVMMKARSYNRRIFSRGVKCNVAVINESNGINKFTQANVTTDKKQNEIGEYLIDVFRHAKEIGSLQTVEAYDYDTFSEYVDSCEVAGQMDLFSVTWSMHTAPMMKKLIEQAKILSRKYAVVCTNPPYMNKLEGKLKEFVVDRYKPYSGDLFSVFMYRNFGFCKQNGYSAFMTPFVWMFIKTYENLRQYIIDNKHITTLVQMEYSAFEEATVPICSFVLQNTTSNNHSLCFRLSAFKGGMEVQKKKVLEALENKDCGYFYEADQSNFSKIPGSPVAYWVSKKVFNLFDGKHTSDFGSAKVGIGSGNTDYFLKLWFEISFLDIDFNRTNNEISEVNFAPINKGGSFRKWYGNFEYVIKWKNNGAELKNYKDNKGNKLSYPRNLDYQLKESITWGDITSSSLSFRYSDIGNFFSDVGNSFFMYNRKYLYYFLAYANTKFFNSLSSVINQTMHFKPGNMEAMPVVISEHHIAEIDSVVKENINISKTDWNSFETSWDFKRHPLCGMSEGMAIFAGMKVGEEKWINKFRNGYACFSPVNDFIIKSEQTNNNEQGDKYEGVFARLKKSNPKIDEMRNKFGDDLEEITDGSYIMLRRKSCRTIPVFCMYGFYKEDAEIANTNELENGNYIIQLTFTPSEKMFEKFLNAGDDNNYIDTWCSGFSVGHLQREIEYELDKDNIKHLALKVNYDIFDGGEFFIEPTENYPELGHKAKRLSYQKELRFVLPEVHQIDKYIVEYNPLNEHSIGISKNDIRFNIDVVGHDKQSFKIEGVYDEWAKDCEERFNQLKANEEELNHIFIDIYGLQDELTPEVEDKDVTVRKADLQRDIKSLLSYAVGCMFGRYSLDEPGLAYAGGEWDDSKYSSFIPDQDNCIPITDEEYFDDDIVGLFCAWLKKVYGEDTLEENLDFIAKALGNKGATSREVIRNYFLTDFIKDHIKIYQKRPIYWLFDSGKKNGFKALVYMHRWNADTVGNLRVEYLHKMQHTYEREIVRMQETIDNSRDSREVSKATKRKDKLQKQLKETKDYDAKLAHIALSRIDIDLDDGVKVNYEKVQTGRDGKKMQILAKI